MLFFTALVVFTISLVLLDFIFSLRKPQVLKRALLLAMAKSILGIIGAKESAFDMFVRRTGSS